MAKQFYSTAADVISATGIRKEDLGIDTDEKLTEWIEARLVEIKDMIDHDRNRDYHAEEEEKGTDVPPGIHGIALRMMANHISNAQARRSTPIIRVDDFAIRPLDERVFTPGIKEDLKRYPKKPRFKFIPITGGD